MAKKKAKKPPSKAVRALRARIKKLGLTHEAFAQKRGFSPSRFGNWLAEIARPKLEEMRVLKKKDGIDYEWWLT